MSALSILYLFLDGLLSIAVFPPPPTTLSHLSVLLSLTLSFYSSKALLLTLGVFLCLKLDDSIVVVIDDGISSSMESGARFFYCVEGGREG